MSDEVKVPISLVNGTYQVGIVEVDSGTRTNVGPGPISGADDGGDPHMYSPLSAPGEVTPAGVPEPSSSPAAPVP